MRRLAAIGLAAVVLPACSGEQGERAHQLLTRAEAAQSRLTSATYEAQLTFVVDGQRFALTLDGGGYLKGPRAGDQVLRMKTDQVPGVGTFDLRVLMKGGRASLSMNGQSFAMPAQGATAKQLDWSSTVMDMARYVKRVKVREGRVVNGERGSTVAGVIDTIKLIEALQKLQPLAKATGQSTSDLSTLQGQIGDIHAAVFIAERTGLIRSAVISTSIKAEGTRADVQLTYRLSSTNKAVPGL